MVRAAPPPMYVHMLTTTRFRFDRKVERERREKKLAAGSCGREVAAEVVYTLPTVVSPAAMVFRLLWCDGPRPERASISADTTEDDPHASRSSANASSNSNWTSLTFANASNPLEYKKKLRA